MEETMNDEMETGFVKVRERGGGDFPVYLPISF